MKKLLVLALISLQLSYVSLVCNFFLVPFTFGAILTYSDSQ